MKRFSDAVVMWLFACLTLVSSTAFAEGWAPYCSEESNRESLCEGQERATGYGCSGSYCDNNRLYCQPSPWGLALDQSRRYWTARFSEENDSSVCRLHASGFCYMSGTNWNDCSIHGNGYGMVTGIRCSGSNCDNLELQCTPIQAYSVAPRCWWTSESVSEERGGQMFVADYNHYISGISCSGRFCDNVSFRVCTFN